jgi:hypothetical protein
MTANSNQRLPTNRARLDVDAVRQAIADLLLANPELEEDDVLRADMIEAQTGAFEYLSRLVRAIGMTEALDDGLAAYITELKERRSRLEQRVHSLKTLISKVMNAADLSKAELAEATIFIRRGVKRVIITEEEMIPRDYLRIKTEPDKTKIKEAITAGGTVPGAVLSNAEDQLVINVK